MSALTPRADIAASRLAILIIVAIGLPQPQCEKNGKATDKEQRQIEQLT
jgi:hypothetical protein